MERFYILLYSYIGIILDIHNFLTGIRHYLISNLKKCRDSFALDHNSNDKIDNGGELFGVDTSKADGTKATDGFDALSDLDSNDDGVFDDKGTRFADVCVWCDLNQDSISQSSELSTLAANNIRSISLSKTSSTTNLGNGNTQTATVTRTDDTTDTAANRSEWRRPNHRFLSLRER